MHSLLSNYLKQVSKRLSPMPQARRKTELLELEQHLAQATAVKQERGQSITEAVANALRDFGSASEVAEKMVEAWVREDTAKTLRLRWALAGVLVITRVILCVISTKSNVLSKVADGGGSTYNLILLWLLICQTRLSILQKSRTHSYQKAPPSLFICVLVSLTGPMSLAETVSKWHTPLLSWHNITTLFGFINYLMMYVIGLYIAWGTRYYAFHPKANEGGSAGVTK